MNCYDRNGSSCNINLFTPNCWCVSGIQSMGREASTNQCLHTQIQILCCLSIFAPVCLTDLVQNPQFYAFSIRKSQHFLTYFDKSTPAERRHTWMATVLIFKRISMLWIVQLQNQLKHNLNGIINFDRSIFISHFIFVSQSNKKTSTFQYTNDARFRFFVRTIYYSISFSRIHRFIDTFLWNSIFYSILFPFPFHFESFLPMQPINGCALKNWNMI